MTKNVKKEDKPTDRVVDIVKRYNSTHKDQQLALLNGDSILDVPRRSTGIISLDILTGGGYPHGRIVEVYGPESAGKTTLTLHAIAEVQKSGGVAAFIDAEHSLDLVYASKLGVNTSKLIIHQPDYGEQALDVMINLTQFMGKGDLIVIDSVAALTPKDELDGLMGEQHMGLHARIMGQAMRKLTSSLSKSGAIAFFTNQIRQKIGIVYGPSDTTTGGNALKFYSTIRIEVRRVGSTKDGDVVTGNKTRLKTVKNKSYPPYRECETEIKFGEGIPRYLDVMNLGIACGVIEKSSSWISIPGGQKFNGNAAAMEFLKVNPEVLGEIEKAVLKVYGYNR